jgi:hypothetical protein
MNPNDERHGTYAGAVQHWNAGEHCCDACRRAATRYRKGLKWEEVHGSRRTVSPLGAVRRLQALQRLGWSIPAIARVTGLDHRLLYAVGLRHQSIRKTTHDAIVSAYEQLSMTKAPETTTAERISATRARMRAARNGFAPPLAWDDIDDPDEQPSGWLRVQPERGELLTDLDEDGANIFEACRELKLSRDALERWCERHGMNDVFSRLVRRANPDWAGSGAGAA